MKKSSSRRPIVRVALDGPAGVGKTTTARSLADQLGYLYVDTGAMYRALAVHAIRSGISVDDPEATAALAAKTRVELRAPKSKSLEVLVDGSDVSREIRTREASDGASRISIHPGVRTSLVAWQRKLAARRSVVMEGRDIGTVVLSDAEAKIFLTASAEERARRRYHELLERGQNPSFEAVFREIQERDRRDEGRETSPLRPAGDAVVIDCTALNLSDQVAAVRRVVEALAAD